MSIFTKKLNLFKYVYNTDKNNTFNLETALNNNFDKIEAAMPLFKYNADIEFDEGDWVIYGNCFYISLIDENIGNTPSSSPNAWQLFQVGTLRKYGELVFSAIPQDDNKLRLTNGDVLYRTSNNGLYAGFIDKMAQLAQLTPNYFCTEEQWQNILSSSQKQSCGKFVYNSTQQSLRLPKINTIIEAVTDLSVLGNLIAAGLPQLSTNSTGSHNHTASTNSTGAHNHTATCASAGAHTHSTGKTSDEDDGGGRFTTGEAGTDPAIETNSAGSHKHTITIANNSNHSHTVTINNNGAHSHTAEWNGHVLNTVQPETIKQLIYIVVAQ